MILLNSANLATHKIKDQTQRINLNMVLLASVFMRFSRILQETIMMNSLNLPDISNQGGQWKLPWNQGGKGRQDRQEGR